MVDDQNMKKANETFRNSNWYYLEAISNHKSSF